MATEKRGLLCEFKPDKLKPTPEMREWFTGSYPRFIEDDSLEFKCWFVNQERGTWGALYIWESAEALADYVNGDVWNKVVPEKYGCKPTWQIVEVGPIIAKKEIRVAKDSWMGD